MADSQLLNFVLNMEEQLSTQLQSRDPVLHFLRYLIPLHPVRLLYFLVELLHILLFRDSTAALTTLKSLNELPGERSASLT